MVTATLVGRRWAIVGGGLLGVLTAAVWASQGVLSRLATERAMRELRETFASEVELKHLDIAVFPRFRAVGEGLILHYRGRSDLPPLIAIRRFTVGGGWLTFFTRHLRQVRLEGLAIQIPPKAERGPQEKKWKSQPAGGIAIDEIVADGTILKTLPKDPEKEPLVWEIRHLTLHHADTSAPMSFRAVVLNAKPPGNIESSGNFGPWQTEEPGETALSGQYTFQNADLAVFRGIAGTLSSQGTYRGVLRRIEVQGDTDTPDFAVRVSGNPVHLKTQFQAVVDGADGDTWLQPVAAQFGRSSLVARGAVEGPGGVKGKTISLDVIMEHGRLEDLLRLGVKGRDAKMSGRVGFRGKLVIPPGEVDITKKMTLDGEFQAASAYFSNREVQERVNKLSHKGQGEPREPASDIVASDFAGHFQVYQGVANFRDLSFRVPGVNVVLNGHYGLLDETVQFHGTAKLEAKLSQTTTGFKSFLLKAVDPFFRKKDAGAVLRIKITGTRDQPSFGLDLRAPK